MELSEQTILDAEDRQVRPRCLQRNPDIKADRRSLGLPCVRREGHPGIHLGFQTYAPTDPFRWYSW